MIIVCLRKTFKILFFVFISKVLNNSNQIFF